MASAALAGTLAVLGAACGGTLEGKYRRGELTSSTTTSRPAATSSTTPAPPGGGAPTTTSSTVATSGNAARGARRG